MYISKESFKDIVKVGKADLEGVTTPRKVVIREQITIIEHVSQLWENENAIQRCANNVNFMHFHAKMSL